MQVQKSRPWRYIWCYAFASLTVGLVSNLTGASTSYLAKLAKCSETDLLPVVAGQGVGFLLGAIPGALLLEHPAFSHWVFGLSLVLQAVTLAVVPSCQNLICLTLTFTVQAVTFSFVAAGAISLAMQLLPAKQNLIVNINCAAQGLGSTLCPLIISITVVAAASTSLGYYLIAGVTAIFAAVMVLNGSPTELTKPADSALSWQRLRSYDWAVLGPSLVNAFTNLSVQAAYGTWVYTYALQDYHLDSNAASFVNASFWAAYTVGGILSTGLVHLLSPEAVLFVMTPLAVVGPVAAVLAPSAAQNLAVLSCCSVAVGLGNACGLANSIALAARFLGSIDGLLTTMFGIAAGLGTAILPILVPGVAESAGMGVLMWMTAGGSALQLALVAGILAAGRRPRPPRRTATMDKVPLLDAGDVDIMAAKGSEEDPDLEGMGADSVRQLSMELGRMGPGVLTSGISPPVERADGGSDVADGTAGHQGSRGNASRENDVDTVVLLTGDSTKS